MKNRVLSLVILAGFFGLSAKAQIQTETPSSIKVVGSGPAVDQTKAFFDELLALGKIAKEDAELKSEPAKASIDKLSKQIDFRALAATSLGATWKKVGAKKQAEFLDLLEQMIQKALYPKSKNLGGKVNEIEVSAVTNTKNSARVRGRYEYEKKGELVEKSIEIILHYKGAKVVDADLEGEKISANLKRQFDQALKKKTFDQLLDQMRNQIKGKPAAAPAKAASGDAAAAATTSVKP